jgi:hypothetical protein
MRVNPWKAAAGAGYLVSPHRSTTSSHPEGTSLLERRPNYVVTGFRKLHGIRATHLPHTWVVSGRSRK